MTVDRVHVLSELGFAVSRAGDELRGTATVVPEMYVPGTETLRISILTAWADVLTGLLTVAVVEPRVPVTLGIDIHLFAPPTAVGEVELRARLVKAGKDVLLSSVAITDGAGNELGTANAQFMVAPDPDLRMAASGDELVAAMAVPKGSLLEPFADRAGCERREPGVAILPTTSDETSNSSKTLNGGLIALLVEEAALSTEAGSTLSTMTIHYVRPVRVGPALAVATRQGAVSEVVVTDEGRDGALAVKATTRSFGRAEGRS